MKQLLDKDRFGPWALVTGASSGIGKELSRQLAANGINVVMAARRIDLLKEVGDGIEREFTVEFRAVQVDLSEEGFIDKIKDATRDLDIGLLVSNAGAARAGEFVNLALKDLHDQISVNVVAHMELVRYFAPRLVKRARGGDARRCYGGVPWDPLHGQPQCHQGVCLGVRRGPSFRIGKTRSCRDP